MESTFQALFQDINENGKYCKDWLCIGEKYGVTIYKKESHGSSCICVKGVGVINAPPQACQSTLKLLIV
jgi:hypothetical protein